MHHAWLIIAHNEFGILQRLVSALDAPECDFFLHVDRKVSALPDLQVSQGRLHVLEDRVDVRWGSVSQIECELTLLEAARKESPFDFYHIISGTHFPLMPIQQILRFFDSLEGHIIFHDLCVSTPYQEWFKLRSFNILTRHYGYGAPSVRRLCQFINRFGHSIQKILRIERNKQISFHKASNWASFPEDAVRLLIDRKPLVKNVSVSTASTRNAGNENVTAAVTVTVAPVESK